MKKAESVDEYISDFPSETQKKLEEIRVCIKNAAPQTTEVISYAMPAYKQKRVLVYFAGYKNHIGFYPTSSGIREFQAEFNKLSLKSSKGAVQFPLDKPLPFDLIERIVKYRAAEDLAK